MSDSFCESFSFNANQDAKILILGSMPGVKSLNANQYYAHPQNAFWKIIESLFNISKDLSYETRLKKLRQKRVALWDVAFQCERTGSLDSKILSHSVVANDFEKFFTSHSHIEAIFFNGQKAETLFKRFVCKTLKPDFCKIPRLTLPSTSPAHANLTTAEKIKIWKTHLKDYLI